MKRFGSAIVDSMMAGEMGYVKCRLETKGPEVASKGWWKQTGGAVRE